MRDYADTIGKLMDKAERTDNKEEREALETKIVQMMAKHSIDLAVATAARKERGEKHVDDELIKQDIWYRGQYAQALQYWTDAIGSCFSCETTWYGPGRSRSQRGTTLWGFRSDVEQADALIQSLRVQMLAPLKELQAEQRHRWYATTVGPFIERRSFVQGFVNGAAAKLHNERRALVAGEYKSSSTELILRDRRTEVDAFVKQQLPELKKNKSKGVEVDGRGYSAGHAAGREADVSLGKNRKAIGA